MRAIDLLDVGGRRRTPYFEQTEASECGLACLAMVAGYHGLATDMPALRRRFSLSLKGAKLKVLVDVAEQIGLNSRPLRGEVASLCELPLPTILHWDLNHFVVLAKIRRRLGRTSYVIHDPARGVKTIGERELARHFTGVALELSTSERFQPRNDASRLRISQLWSKLSGLWAALRQVLLLSIVLQVIALASPFYLQLAVDTAFPSADSDLLLMLALGFGGLAIINMLTTWLRSLVLVTLGSALSYQVITNLNRHLLRLPLCWFEKRHVGDIVSRFGSTRPIADLLSQGLIAAAIDGAMAFITLGLMYVYSPLLASVAAVALLLFVALRVAFLHALRLRSIDAITAAAKENTSFIETVRGISAIKAFGQEGNRQRIWQQKKADAVNAEVRLGRLMAGFDAAGQFLLAFERVVFVYLAIRMGMGGAFTVGMIFAFQAYKQQFLDATMRLTEQAINYKLLGVHLNRIADIALTKPEGAADGADLAVPVLGEIAVRGVVFRYGTGEPDVLRGVNLKVEAGEMVALVGPSGGGKTTLLKIMMGLIEPITGEVSVDGRPLASLGVEQWRRRIGSVTQDDCLYAGSLAENIAFFDPEIDMEKVFDAARLASIHDDILRMPLGYESVVGDMGSALSGGQKQRVLLARALYGKPAVLFIDEGTAHLDAAAEAAVMAAIKELPITRIISAHRAGAASMASRLLHVSQGRVAPVSPSDGPQSRGDEPSDARSTTLQAAGSGCAPEPLSRPSGAQGG